MPLPQPTIFHDKWLEAWRTCQRCPLCQTRKQVVLGCGPVPADVMLVGEAPGASEDVVAIPFFGRSGRLLHEGIETAKSLMAIDGVNTRYGYPTIFIDNVIACRPPDNRDPSGEEAWACWPRLERTYNLVQPRVVLLVGATAQKHCRKVWPNSVNVVHPAWLVRRGGTRAPEYRAFVQRLREALEGALV